MTDREPVKLDRHSLSERMEAVPADLDFMAVTRAGTNTPIVQDMLPGDETWVRPVNTSFSLEVPNLQFAWDSTSLGALKTCPQLYKYSIIDGYSTRSENVHFVFGIAVHSALEEYDRSRAKGKDHDTAVYDAMRRALKDTWDFTKGRPWNSPDPNKNRLTLIRSIVWYLEQFENDPARTIILANGKPAVELSFRFDAEIDSHVSADTYLLCGHLDKMVELDEKIWVLDRKTSKQQLGDKYFDKYSPDNQMSLYDIAGNLIYQDRPIAGIIIDAMQVGVTFTRFQRGRVYRSKTMKDEWLKDLTYYLRQAEQYAIDDYYPKNDKSCQQYGGCPFRLVCAASPESRPNLLNGLFTRRTWDPLITREI